MTFRKWISLLPCVLLRHQASLVLSSLDGAEMYRAYCPRCREWQEDEAGAFFRRRESKWLVDQGMRDFPSMWLLTVARIRLNFRFLVGQEPGR